MKGDSMILFDKLVDQALKADAAFKALRPVIEKEILHHDILRIMNDAGLLKELTFIGGTCLRTCYGSKRLSEDLDFTAGSDFSEDLFLGLSDVFQKAFLLKYDLPVEVRIPKESDGTVKTWKLLVQTRSEAHLPAQRIHIDVNSMPSYDIKPKMLSNHYNVDLGTSGLIIKAGSLKEIMTDKFLAIGLRQNRIKNRDLWDILWLNQRGISFMSDILLKKLHDYQIERDEYCLKMESRVESLFSNDETRQSFIKEMRRFLPQNIAESLESSDYWTVLSSVFSDKWIELKAEINSK